MGKQAIRPMNGGTGETSYAKNSAIQREIISLARDVTEDAVLGLCTIIAPQRLLMADVGCSCGPTAFSIIHEILELVDRAYKLIYKLPPELLFFLNDLPGNDFNNIFCSLPEFQSEINRKKAIKTRPCFVAAMPGSFYGRLFPEESVHFVHSSSSLHWLSQVPPELKNANGREPLNKGCIYISETSPASVANAYMSQFRRDFSLFLRSRSEEIVAGGRMVLSFIGRGTTEPWSEIATHQWQLIAQALGDMVLEGIVEKEKVDIFNVPYYSPSIDEVKSEVEEEGSFTIHRFHCFEVEWDAGDCKNDTPKELFRQMTRGQRVSKTIRAVTESMLGEQFGHHIMDDLFQRYADIVDAHMMKKKRCSYINFVLSLMKK